MNPDIKKSIVDIIKANLVSQPDKYTLESVEYIENPQSQTGAQPNQTVHSIGDITVTATRPAPAKAKARGVKSAIRKLLGRKETIPQAKVQIPKDVENTEYACKKLFTIKKQPVAYGTQYTLMFDGMIFEDRIVYQEQEKLTPAQQDLVDIYNNIVRQFDAQLRNGYGPKMSVKEMMMQKYLKSLQK